MLSEIFQPNPTVSTSSLSLLKAGEQGIVTNFQSKDENIIKKLMAMGLLPGMSVTLEQRFPSFVIKIGHTRLALDHGIASSIYVQLTQR